MNLLRLFRRKSALGNVEPVDMRELMLRDFETTRRVYGSLPYPRPEIDDAIRAGHEAAPISPQLRASLDKVRKAVEEGINPHTAIARRRMLRVVGK